MKKEKIRLRDRTPENDIKFKGVLSYRHLRIIAWVCLILAQAASVIKINMNLNPATVPTLTGLANFFSFFSDLPIPLFLLANFAYILQRKSEIKRLLIFYGGVALGLYAVANIVVIHYVHGLLSSMHLSSSLYATTNGVGELLPLMGKSGYILNIFIDLFLCTLLFFFLNYQPKKVFTGKKIIIFRLFYILPLLYEIGGVVIKYMVTNWYFTIPSYVFFLLPSKPPFIFLAFAILVLVMKINDVKHLKRDGNSLETLEQYVSTNAHALRMSIGISVLFAITAIADVIVTLLIALIYTFRLTDGTPEITQLLFAGELQTLSDVGFMGAVPLISLIPLVIFFSYKKQHKNKMIDTLIPVVGIGLIVFVYFEGIFEVITINMPVFIEKLKDAINGFMGGGGESSTP